MSLRGEGNYRSISVAVALVSVITLAAYGQLVTFDFINYDDPYFITLNAGVTGGMTPDNILWAFSTSRMGIWHPLTWMSYQLEISLFGPGNPGAHHAVNLILHLFNAILVLFLCMRLTGAVWASMLIAILFSIHPQHVQPVAWISERKEVLAALFFFLSLNFYLQYLSQPGKKGLYTLSIVAFGAALLCKPSVAPLPIILLLVHLFYGPLAVERGMASPSPKLDKASLLKIVRDKIPFLLLGAVVSVITIYIKKSGHWAEYEESLHLGRRMLLMPIGLLHYVKTLLFPWPNPMWIEAPDGMPYLRSLMSAGVITVLGIGIWHARKRVPEMLFGALWFVIMWLPVSGIVIVSNYYVADRYTYLPFVGGLFGLVFFARKIFCSVLDAPRVAAAIATIVVSVSTVLAYQQASYWRNSIDFFERETAVNPDSAAAPLYVGHALLVQGRHQAALNTILRGLDQDNDQPTGHVFKGHALRGLGRVDEAIRAYKSAIEHGYSHGDVYVHLGILLMGMDEIEEAVILMERGLDRFPEDIHLLNYLAYVYGYRLERPEDSRSLYERTLRQQPDNVDALLGLGVILLREGEIETGSAKLERLLQLDPDNAPALKAIRKYGNE